MNIHPEENDLNAAFQKSSFHKSSFGLAIFQVLFESPLEQWSMGAGSHYSSGGTALSEVLQSMESEVD
ncbi:hypothetical protein QYF36_005943 [Acer negundo]|nr:hypothetical protein QYF36_005943 [Acer negundo]